MRRREFISLLGGAAAAGRWRRARSRLGRSTGLAFWPMIPPSRRRRQARRFGMDFAKADSLRTTTS